MKKLIALLLGLMMAFSLVACGDPSGNTGGGGGGSGGGGGGDNPIVTPGEDYDPNDPNQYIYREVFADSPYKSQWDTSRSGAELDGIWDSSVLPDKIPEKPSSVTEVDRTEYVGKLDNKYNYNPPGKLTVEYEDESDGKPWEYYMVMFTGTMDTFNTLVLDFATNFACYDDRDDGMGETRFGGEFHAYSTDLYVFMSYQENGSYNSDTYEFEGDGTVWFTIYAMPVHHQLPKLVEGVPLMQAGYMMWFNNYLTCYNDTDEDFTELPYDYQTGTATGTVKENWTADELVYYGATVADVETWGTQLVNAGFTLSSSESNYWYYSKGDINVTARYSDEYKSVTVYVQVGSWW